MNIGTLARRENDFLEAIIKVCTDHNMAVRADFIKEKESTERDYLPPEFTRNDLGVDLNAFAELKFYTKHEANKEN